MLNSQINQMFAEKLNIQNCCLSGVFGVSAGYSQPNFIFKNTFYAKPRCLQVLSWSLWC